MTSWRAVQRELAHWAAAGRRLGLWWRDDDAREPGEALDRLLALARPADAPLTLAVIPDGERRQLATRLAFEPLISVIQHGVDHVNVNRRGPAGEFALGCPRTLLRSRLSRSRSRLAILPRFAPVFCPPWNAIHPQLADCLTAEGYRGLSANGQFLSVEDDLARVDVHIDLLRWKGGSRFRGDATFLRQFVALARARRQSGQWDQPIGLLTHHLVHDEAGWRFLGEFLDMAAGNPTLNWRRIEDLLPPASTEQDRTDPGRLSCG